ncbi:endonuclease/exonuclease/phosphatase family protein [Streptomyces sp. BR123]|uniref:endonuclease/exonuclease/phosphatase family protein n=1 Tax=Streptomyces sp. BR123 TaxID=2749828 RepID=UPI0015C497FB|nr:endonuclease/exonuclease/phosphatase family protein [Streptomyces sp. BR123]NXY97654.1 endonuclease/exonuclease/phosphatase family protein [Streptomyces sp. BR123]
MGQRKTGPWAAVAVGLGAVAGGLPAFHRALPDLPGRPAGLLETFLPWFGLAVPVLLGRALLRRSAPAGYAAVLPAAAWIWLFGGFLLPGPAPDRAPDLVAVQHNVSDENPDPAGTARALAATGADLIALEELTPAALPAYTAALAPQYPYHAAVGTVGLWSKHPLADARPLDIRPAGLGEDWNRGLRATARTPRGQAAVYVAHLPSLRLGAHGFGSALRDESAVLLGKALAAEALDRVVLLGDLNSTVDDRGLAPVTARMTRPARDFAFSWPAALPVARIDQVLTRSATVVRVRALPGTGSDHLPVAADIRF